MAVSDIKEFSKPIRKGIVDRGWIADAVSVRKRFIACFCMRFLTTVRIQKKDIFKLDKKIHILEIRSSGKCITA
jgi:hypothetical protein